MTRCLLVVDADEDAADQLAAALRSRGGFDVHVAYGGADGIDLSCQLRPDTVVMNVSMPFVNGMEAGEILTRLFGRRRPRLIAIVPRDAAFDVRALDAAGFAEHLVEPVDLKQLVILLGQPS